ncbi:MAG TPA: hypothetical protein VGP47_01415 [Parachlamydiaceae bacterium]|nr:hypothetical protein [Parachlamydiaceae bacterium]
MKRYILPLLATFLAWICALQGIEFLQNSEPVKKIVTSTKQLYLQEYPGAWNPSIVKFRDGYLLTFRWAPNRIMEPWVSHIGIVLLNKTFDPISKPELLDTRVYNGATPSQAEDARIMCMGDKLYLFYNDNMDLIFPSHWERRDMYVAELICKDDEFELSQPMRLRHKTKYRDRPWQKNWTPFEWKDKLLLSYSINPHEIIVPDLDTGICAPFNDKKSLIPQDSWLFGVWEYDSLRGGTPAQLVDGEYLAFFHSGIITKTAASEHKDIWHYFMGAYTFSAEPPFVITKASQEPIDATGFYTYSSYSKRVIYPGGFIHDGSNIYLAYGKDDSEIWIATLDLAELKNSMVKIKTTIPEK